MKTLSYRTAIKQTCDSLLEQINMLMICARNVAETQFLRSRPMALLTEL